MYNISKQVVMPRYDLYKNGGILTEDFITTTRIKGRTCTTDEIHLEPTGELWIREGKEWDFGTGAVDTPAVIMASLVHDILCELIQWGKLPTTLRKKIDKEYLRYLKLGGMPWYRRYWQYYAIRFYVKFVKPWWE